MSNSKNIWKGIKSLITMKNVLSTVPRTPSHGENTITIAGTASRTLIISINTFLNT